MTYFQGPASWPDDQKRRCAVLVFEQQIGNLMNATRAEIRMEVETARALRDKLDVLLDRIDRDALEPDDDIDYEG